ncbi:MAG: BlaI/MecI/CopY family transcriptional regulator [Candidatus Hydrogenedentes bacterium]|nr:BlaI/MecI/CopY family transcriptional regulator [Candidatus Hydrogenedentota bacterium]
MKSASRPSELELQVLALMWENGPLTAREVSALMPDGKSRAYTTVLSVLQVMEKKGLVSHTQDGRANRYAAKAAKRAVLGPMLRQMVANVFGGSPSAAVQHLLQETKVSADELSEIRKVIAEHDTASKRGGKAK